MFTLCELLTFWLGFGILTAMNTKNIDETQDLPVMISDKAWQSILPFLKASANVYVGNPEDCRRFVSAIVWITKEGATWRALPKAYGYWNSIYRRFGRWSDAGVFENLHEYFHEAGELSALLVDSTIVRAHSCAAGAPKKNGGQDSEALGRSHGGFTTKLNAAVSDTFLPLRFILTAGACHDVPRAPALIAGYACKFVIADAAYDSDAFRAEIVAQGGVAVIRPRKNRVQERPYDKEMYKLRNVIERFFHRLKQYRRVATRYDKYAVRYLAFVFFAAILITFKKM